jgi:hypothetical protein
MTIYNISSIVNQSLPNALTPKDIKSWIVGNKNMVTSIFWDVMTTVVRTSNPTQECG